MRINENWQTSRTGRHRGPQAGRPRGTPWVCLGALLFTTALLMRSGDQSVDSQNKVDKTRLYLYLCNSKTTIWHSTLILAESKTTICYSTLFLSPDEKDYLRFYTWPKRTSESWNSITLWWPKVINFPMGQKKVRSVCRLCVRTGP